MSQPKADVILFGGTIITMDEDNPVVEAVSISGNTILQAGSIDNVFRNRNPGTTKMIYLNQQALMPGLIEPHQHPIQVALMRSLFIDIGAVTYR